MGAPYVKTPLIYQMEAAECGAACLATVLGYFGSHIPLEKLRADMGVSRDGCNAAVIIRTAEQYGIRCRGFKKSVEGLLSAKPPCVIHWDYNHFVVYEGIKRGRISVADPAQGRRLLEKDEFCRRFTGIVLTFEKKDCFVPMGKKTSAFSEIRARVESEKRGFAAAFMLRAFSPLFVAAAVLVSKAAVDSAHTGGSPFQRTTLAVLMVCLFVLCAVFEYTGRRKAARAVCVDRIDRKKVVSEKTCKNA